MEISDSFIKIESLKDQDEQDEAFDKKMDVIHDYQEKYKNLSKKDRKIAEEFYQEWQIADGIPGWVKSLIWTTIISTCCIFYTMKKRQMYCFKQKDEDVDSQDDHYNQL